MPEHDNGVAYWIQRYNDTISEHNKELTEYRKHLGNKYKPVLDRIMLEFTKAQVQERSNENSNSTPPPENSKPAGALLENENSKGGTV